MIDSFSFYLGAFVGAAGAALLALITCVFLMRIALNNGARREDQ